MNRGCLWVDFELNSEALPFSLLLHLQYVPIEFTIYSVEDRVEIGLIRYLHVFHCIIWDIDNPLENIAFGLREVSKTSAAFRVFVRQPILIEIFS
jgi:hypothetical protein